MTGKKPSFDWTNPFAVTNLLIIILWRLAAGIIALTVRLIILIILAIINRVQRARIGRW